MLPKQSSHSEDETWDSRAQGSGTEEAVSELMASSLQKIEGDDSVLLRVTHSNIKTFSADIRFSLQTSVESVKEKLWKKCGTSVNSMHLELYDDAKYKISDLTDNSMPLGIYSPLDGFRLHVIDLDPSSVTSGGWLEDTSLVEKYTISEEAYNKREGMFSYPFPPLLNLRCILKTDICVLCTFDVKFFSRIR